MERARRACADALRVAGALDRQRNRVSQTRASTGHTQSNTQASALNAHLSSDVITSLSHNQSQTRQTIAKKNKRQAKKQKKDLSTSGPVWDGAVPMSMGSRRDLSEPPERCLGWSTPLPASAAA
eukprot:2052087-Rhodomonas_salina.3